VTPLIASLIAEAAAAAGLDAALVRAIVRVESDGDRYAWNPEPRYRYLWNVRSSQPFRTLTFAELASEAPPVDFPSLAGDRDQEWWGQQASWGLMQIMGAVAREEGFTATFLPELTDPAANLVVGCRHLRGLVRWAGGNVAKAAAAYNTGRGNWQSAAGRTYSAKVLAAIE
jgi:soluble lytic murein transglycosylase-like protein